MPGLSATARNQIKLSDQSERMFIRKDLAIYAVRRDCTYLSLLTDGSNRKRHLDETSSLTFGQALLHHAMSERPL